MPSLREQELKWRPLAHDSPSCAQEFNGSSGVLTDALMRWWTHGIQLNLCIRPTGVVLALVYAVLMVGVRQISFDHLYLPAGVRVAFLVLCPPRLWPYLLAGEYAYLATLRYPLIERYGLAWVLVGSLFTAPLVALVVRAYRGLFASRIEVWMLAVAASAALGASVLNVSLSTLMWPVSTSLVDAAAKAGRYVIGDFIGILAVVPLAILWMRRSAEPFWSKAFVVPAAVALTVMLALGVSASFISPDSTQVRTSLQLLMMLPAILLTRTHGWRGAALSVPLLSLMMGLTISASHTLVDCFDPEVFKSQQMLAIVSICLLALGASVSRHYHHYAAGDAVDRRAAMLARASHLAAERDLRERANSINRIGDGIDAHLSETADWLMRQGHHAVASNLIDTASIYSRKFREQASMVYPTTLEHVGLYLALQVGGINEAWESTERMAQPRFGGDPCQLSVGLQLAVYRTLTDAVSMMLQHESGQLRVQARCGQWKGRKGMLATVTVMDSGSPLSDVTTKLAVDSLGGRSLGYGGTVECRRNRIRMVFVEPLEDQRTVSSVSSSNQTAPSPLP